MILASFMIFSILPSIAKEFRSGISPFLQIVSKAFEKSAKQVYNFLFSWNCLSINVFRTNMLLEVLIDGLKLIILSLNRLSSSKHLASLDRSRLLINLLRHEVRLIPL